MLYRRTRIVAAVDLSDAARPVAEAAASLAQKLRAEVWLLHVIVPEPPWVSSGDIGFTPMPAPPAHAEVVQDHQKFMDEIAASLAPYDIPVHSQLCEHPSASAVVEEVGSLEPDLIVLGSHRHGTWHHALLGSTRERLVRHAPCPVLVVPVPTSHPLPWNRSAADKDSPRAMSNPDRSDVQSGTVDQGPRDRR